MAAGQFDQTVNVLRTLTAAGPRCYALSNMEREVFAIRSARFPFMKWFDGQVISGFEGAAKPDIRIFEVLLARYDPDPGVTVFVDDSKRNVEAALALGFSAVHYTSAHQLKTRTPGARPSIALSRPARSLRLLALLLDRVDDQVFVGYVSDRLYELPGVAAVSLGGSRGQGTNRPDSDWDFAIYYRAHFDPQSLRDIGWSGEVFEVGGWSDGVFNGGAWLEIDNRRVDVHYRDLDTIDREIAGTREGRFRIEPLMFHLAGIPTYLVLAELAVSRVLRGHLARPDYPMALRETAPPVWWDRASRTFDYARVNHAAYGRLAQCAGLVAQAASQTAHAVLAAAGEWVTNEKTLLTRAGLRSIDQFIASARPDPAVLSGVVDQCRDFCAQRVRQATTAPGSQAEPKAPA